MKFMFIDSHSHYLDLVLKSPVSSMLANMKKVGVAAVVENGTSIASSKKVLEFAKKYPREIWAAVGLHPEILIPGMELYDPDYDVDANLAELEELVKQNLENISAIGECGLDYYWLEGERLPLSAFRLPLAAVNDELTDKQKNNYLDEINKIKEKQKKLFEGQILLAKKYNLPLVVHSRGAENETMELYNGTMKTSDGSKGAEERYKDSKVQRDRDTEIQIYRDTDIQFSVARDQVSGIQRYKDTKVQRGEDASLQLKGISDKRRKVSVQRKEYGVGRVLFHSYTGPQEVLKTILDFGFYVSFNGIITYKKADNVRELFKYVWENYPKQILAETDSPLLAPEGRRGEENEPAYVALIVEKMASLAGSSSNVFAKRIFENTLSFYSKSASDIIDVTDPDDTK